MAKMDKASVIYGQAKELRPAAVNWSEVETAIRDRVGPDEAINLALARKLVDECKNDRSLRNPYVKVGLVGNDLTLRVKDKGILSDTERDALIMRGFKSKAADYEKSQAAALATAPASGRARSDAAAPPVKEAQQAEQAARERAQKLTTAKAAFEAKLGGAETELNTGIPALLKLAEAAIQANNPPEAEKQLQAGKGRIIRFLTPVTKYDAELAKAAQDAGLERGAVPKSDYQARIATAKTKLRAIRTTVAQLEEQFDMIDNMENPASTNADAGYQTRYRAVVQAYNTVLDEIKALVPKGNAVLTKCTNLNGNPLLQANPDGMAKIARKLLQEIKAVEKESEVALFNIRESGGTAVRLRDTTLDTGDRTSFVKLMTRGMTLNGRIITIRQKCTEQLEEALEAIIATGNAAAVPIAQETLAGL